MQLCLFERRACHSGYTPGNAEEVSIKHYTLKFAVTRAFCNGHVDIPHPTSQHSQGLCPTFYQIKASSGQPCFWPSFCEAIILSLLPNKAKYSVWYNNSYKALVIWRFWQFQCALAIIRSSQLLVEIMSIVTRYLPYSRLATATAAVWLKRGSYSTRGFACVCLTEIPKTFAPLDPNGDLFFGGKLIAGWGYNQGRVIHMCSIKFSRFVDC